ncbi:hypothetical protein P7B02_11485 [Caulobacter segnis]|uniref:hypothetical protein n=1 Tax=Caulobacter segnis TaxID=88688 RepID=UPI00240FF694|nr:hypothetical protein [Caulobacter segnis]MDG2522163.1 hypothetical protein [Caulobacter segnis]
MTMMLSSKLFEDLRGGYDSTKHANLAEHVRLRELAHPFAVAWDELTRGAELSKRAGVFQLSEQAYFLLDTLQALSTASNDPEFPDVVERLRDDEQFYSTAFEAQTHSAYRERDVPIAFLPESVQHGVRTPDLVSRSSGRPDVHLECKALLDDVRREDRVWTELLRRTAEKLERQPASFSIRFRAHRRLEADDVSPLCKLVVELLGNFPLLHSGEDAGCEVRIERIGAEGGQFPPGTQFNAPAGKPSWIDTQVDEETGWIKKVSILYAERYAPDADQTKRLLKRFREASEQLPRGQAGVVHLLVPYRDPSHFLSVVDRSLAELENTLSRRPHVAAIVISGRFVETNVPDGGYPVRHFQVVIPNFAASHALPTDFKIIGAVDGAISLARAQEVDLSALPDGKFSVLPTGTIFLHFGIDAGLQSQSGKYLFQHCSDDGRSQLFIWQSYHNNVRFEVVHPDLGRMTMTTDLNHLAPGQLHGLAFNWGPHGVRCSVNGGEALPIQSHGGSRNAVCSHVSSSLTR